MIFLRNLFLKIIHFFLGKKNTATVAEPQVITEEVTDNKTGKCEIVNESGEDVVVILNDQTDSGSQALGYKAGDLTLLQTDSENNVIKNGETAVVNIDLSNENTNQNLIFSRPSDLFPVQSYFPGRSQSENERSKITVSSESASKMKLAETFWQAILSDPSSDLGKNYIEALQKSTANTDPNVKVNESVRAYFDSTDKYKNLTVDEVRAVADYYNGYAFIWPKNSDLMTYYIYTSDSEKVTLSGRIIFSKKSPAPNPADVNDANAGYTISFLAQDNTSTSLVYSNGQLVSDPNVKMPDIALRGNFILKNQITLNADDKGLIPIFMGQVKGVFAMGSIVEKPESPAKQTFQTLAVNGKSDGNDNNNNDDSESRGFWDPKTFGDWAKIIAFIIGIGTVIRFFDWAYLKIKNWRMAPGQRTVTRDQLRAEVNRINDQINTTATDTAREVLNRLADRSGSIPIDIPTDIELALTRARAARMARIMNGQREILLDTLEQMADSVRELANFGMNEQLATTATDIEERYTDLRHETDINTLDRLIAETRTDVPNFKTNINDVLNDFSATMTQEAIETVNQNDRTIDELTRISDLVNDDFDLVKDGREPVFDPWAE